MNITITVQGDLNLTQAGLSEEQFQAISDKLDQILTREDTIIMKETEALAAIQAVADLTTAQGTALSAEGDTLNKISDMIDTLAGKPDVPQSVADALGALSTAVGSVGATIQAHADLSTAILAKGQPPVPVTPVPPVTPVVLPTV